MILCRGNFNTESIADIDPADILTVSGDVANVG